MSTANTSSSRISGLRVNDVSVDEANNAGTNATSETPGTGLFLYPSTVAGRAADVSGFLVTSTNEYGKLQFSDPDGFLSLNDLSDVTITTPVVNQVLVYNGTLWVNGTTPAGSAAGSDTEVQFNNAGLLDGDALFTWDTATSILNVSGDITGVITLSIVKGTITQITSLVTPVTVNAGAGVITTVSATTLAVTSERFTVTNSEVIATSVVSLTLTDYSGTYVTDGIPVITVDNVGAGTFDVVVTNAHATLALAGVLQISFTVL